MESETITILVAMILITLAMLIFAIYQLLQGRSSEEKKDMKYTALFVVVSLVIAWLYPLLGQIF